MSVIFVFTSLHGARGAAAGGGFAWSSSVAGQHGGEAGPGRRPGASDLPRVRRPPATPFAFAPSPDSLFPPSPFRAHHFMRHFAAGDRLAQAHVWNRSYKWLHAASQFSRPDHHLIIAEKDAFIASIFCYFYGLPIVRLQCRSLNVTPAVANTW